MCLGSQAPRWEEAWAGASTPAEGSPGPCLSLQVSHKALLQPVALPSLLRPASQGQGGMVGGCRAGVQAGLRSKTGILFNTRRPGPTLGRWEELMPRQQEEEVMCEEGRGCQGWPLSIAKKGAGMS